MKESVAEVITPEQTFEFLDYGAFELKRSYQKNLSLGLLFAGLIHILIIGSLLLYNYIITHREDTRRVIRITDPSQLMAPPLSQVKPPQISIAEPKVAPPKAAIPKPVPDEEALEEVTIATQEELKENPIFTENTKGSDSIVVNPEELFPGRFDFIPVEEIPAIIKSVEPKYPEFARKGGVEGKVRVAMLVNKEGKVVKVEIAKASGSNTGFEEAAMEAARQFVFKPAIQNQKPVAVWVEMDIHFKLH